MSAPSCLRTASVALAASSSALRGLWSWYSRKSHRCLATAGSWAYLFKSRRSTFTNGPPTSDRMLAVPRRTWRPSDVTGREVPGRLPLNASPTDMEPVPGRADCVPGRTKPVMGRPLLVTGRVDASGPLPPIPEAGRERDVPGLLTGVTTCARRIQ